MNFFVVSTLLSSAALVSCNAKNLTLSDVYGEAAPVSDMIAWSQRSVSLSAPRSVSFRNSRTTENCDFALEVYIVQDNTASTRDNYAEMKDVQLPLLVSAMEAAHEGTTFGIMSFRDKPIWSLGDPNAGDYCERFESPLSADASKLYTVYDNLVPNGGADPAENQFGALVAAMQSSTPGWSNPDATRLVVMVTDAPPHFEGDGLNAYGMTTFSGTFDEPNADAQCLAEYYPGPAEVKAAISAREAYVAFVVFDGDWWNELPAKSWEWFNNYIEQTPDFVGLLNEDSTNFFEQLSNIIKVIENIECGDVTTTEAEETTEETTETTTTAETTTTSTIVSTTTVTTTEEETTTPEATETTLLETTTLSETPAETTGNVETSSTPEGPCHCPACPCPEVEIKLAHRPKHMQLNVEN